MDPLHLMNKVCQWKDPPPPDERWEKTVAALCEHLMNKVCQWKDPPPPDERWKKTVAALCEYATACRGLTFLRLHEINAIKSGKGHEELKKEIYDTVDKIIAMEEKWGII